MISLTTPSTEIAVRVPKGTIDGWPILYGRIEKFHQACSCGICPLAEQWERNAIRLNPLGQLQLSIDHGPRIQYREGAFSATIEDQGLKVLLNCKRLRDPATGRTLWQEVKRGRLDGWSIEFSAQKIVTDTRGVRHIHLGVVNGVSLVKHPAYDYATAHARQDLARPSILPRRWRS